MRYIQLNEGLERLCVEEVLGGQEYEGYAFYGCAIKSIKLPSTLKIIGAKTFCGCDDLKRVEIPNGVEHIGERCFSDSGIEEIALPSTLKMIDEDAF